MPKFYFTYGSDERFPYQYGWTEVEAPDFRTACVAFRCFHPDRDPKEPCLNCADTYPEEAFKNSAEFMKVSPRNRCHERIALTLELPEEDGEANNANWFRNGPVFADSRVYALSRSVTANQDNQEDEISYSIEEYVVTDVGRQYLTAKPASGGKPVKFRPLPDGAIAKGLYLEEVSESAISPLQLYGSLQTAEGYRTLLEKCDERKAQARQ